MCEGEEHQVTLNVSIIQAVEPADKEGSYRESVRAGERKRIYECPTASHHFHTEYKLLPHKSAQVFKTDVVTFGNVVAKVYTERDNRVVRSWEELDQDGRRLNFYGWKHKHSFKVNKAQLLELFDHTLEVRLWNSPSKLSVRAKYDRPKAFRIPAPPGREEGDDDTISKRPAKLSVVYHDQVRKLKPSVRSGSQNLIAGSSSSTAPPAMPQDESGGSIEQVLSRRSFLTEGTLEAAITEAPEDKPEDSVVDKQRSSELAPAGVDQTISGESAGSQESNKQIQVLSRRKRKALEAEAAEEGRIEREGLVVLRVKLLDLFGKNATARQTMSSPVRDLQAFEVSVSVAESLLTEQLSRELNPMMITVLKATGLPATPLSYQELQKRCEPAFVKYQFHNKASHCTSGVAQCGELVWNDTHVVLLGTIDNQLLTEYLRGPPLVMELHDRSKRKADPSAPVLFGYDTRDEVLGTHAFTAGLSHSNPNISLCEEQWSPYGVARLNLSGLLQGQELLELTVPVNGGPRASSEQHTALDIPSADYISSDCQLKVLVELSHPLFSTAPPPQPLAKSVTESSANKRSSSKRRSGSRRTTPEHSTPSKPPSSKESIKTSAKPLIDTCPFNRLIYILSATSGGEFVKLLLSTVNAINCQALGLEGLSGEVLPAALSTYKLSHKQMSSAECDVITGFQIEDSSGMVVMLEGLKMGAIRTLWDTLPHHNTQDEAIVRVFYNSEFEFSERLYASLDVDLPMIRLYQPLCAITTDPLIYIRDSITENCFRALMKLRELDYAQEMGDVCRNSLFPSPAEVTALSLQFSAPYVSEPPNSTGDPSPCDLGLTPTPLARTRSPLQLTNPAFQEHLNKRNQLPTRNFIFTNKERVSVLSRARKPQRQRSLSDTTVHNYSVQTYNSMRLAKARLRERLESEPGQRYTHCQEYHSRTVAPVDTETAPSTLRAEDRTRWRTRAGFLCPGVSSSSAHPKAPHPSRVDSLREQFQDNLLHANTLQPTVDRSQFQWTERGKDFERWKRPPGEFAPELPVTIHLAGESRAAELQETLDQEHRDWRAKLVVDNPRFHPHRQGIRTELTERGPWAGTQLDKLSGLLKNPPQKHSLKTVQEIPALDVVHNQDSSGECGRAFIPGPQHSRSLKLDSNVIPINTAPATNTQGFRLYYHLPTGLPGH